MANLPIFLAAIVETLLVVTKPDSSIQNPAAIHMTRKAQTKNENVLKIYATSISTAAYAPELINNEQIKNPIK
jgi:hypothetical protein